MLSPSTSVTAAAFASSSAVKPPSLWTGWMVPRILPKMIPINDADDNSCELSSSTRDISSTNSQTCKRRLDPWVLCPGKGIDFHPFAAHPQETAVTARHVLGHQSDKDRAAINLQEAVKETTPVLPSTSSESESTTMDVYVLPSGMPPDHAILWKKNDAETEPFLHVRLDRTSNDFVNKTLERMVISLNKQLRKKLNNNKKIKYKMNQKGGDKPQNNSSQVSIWKLTEEQSNAGDTANIQATLRNEQQWDVQHLTNQQLWKEAITTPLLVNLQLIENITLSLRVDACPPTIVAVDTFEDFASRIFCDVPLVVQVQTMFATHTIRDWYVGDQLVCPDSVSYTPQASDIGKYVSVLITPKRNDGHSGQGYEEAYRFENPVEALPENTVVKLRQEDDYEWTNPLRRSLTSTVQPLRVMTFNILADQNAYQRNTPGNRQVSLYPYVDISVLEKARRMPLLLHEILSYQADVICLQEVDQNIWFRLFRPALEQAGYQGYFSSKNARGTSEGCAMLWSLHRFEALPQQDMKHYGLSELVMDIAENHASMSPEWKSAQSIGQVLQDKPDLREVIEKKLGHIVQMVSLSLRKVQTDNSASSPVPDRLLVANTHLFFNPMAAHIRLLQMYAICRQFDQFQQRQQQQSAASYPMILCGDMNSSLRRAAGYLLMEREVLPDHDQIRDHFNVFQWQERHKKKATVGGPSATKSSIHFKCGVRVEHKDDENDEKSEEDWEDFPAIELPTHFPSFLTGYPTEPAFTHALHVFMGSLDHIFISQCSEHNLYGLAPFQSAPMPSLEDVSKNVAMPSENLPSDHVSLVADLTFTKYNQD